LPILVKLLFINPAAALGGSERVLLNLLASLRLADPSLDLHLATNSWRRWRSAGSAPRGG
jgi:hypothetical protein